MRAAPLSSYLFAFIFTLALDKRPFMCYIVVVKDINKEPTKYAKATLANGEVMTFKAGEFALMPRPLDVNVMKIEECSLLEWAKHQTLQPNEDLQVICG